MDFDNDFDREVQESANGVHQAIQDAATVENAKEYAASSEKFTFCIDLLGVSAHHAMAEKWVNQLEDKFDALNESTS